MPSNADYAAMAYARGNRDPDIVALVEQEIASEQVSSTAERIRQRDNDACNREAEDYRIAREGA